MSTENYRLVLGSQSPRRRELLKLAGYNFEVLSSDFDESRRPKLLPKELVLHLAQAKHDQLRQDYAQEICNDILLCADTIVVIDNQVLEKPRDYDEAFEMLSLLSNASHEVLSAVYMSYGDKTRSFYDSCRVKFYPLSDSEIHNYLSSNESFDKAGAYGIQSRGRLLVEAIEGSYDTVVGLPLARCHRELYALCFEAQLDHSHIFSWKG